MRDTSYNIQELKSEKIGHFVSEKLSDYLKKYSSSNDRAKAALKSGVGIHTIQSLAVGRNKITASNFPGLVELVRLSIANCVKQVAEANAAKTDMEKLFTQKESA